MIPNSPTQRSGSDHALLPDELPLATALFGADGACLFLNADFVSMFGYTRDEIASFSTLMSKAVPDPDLRTTVLEWQERLASVTPPPLPRLAFTARFTCSNGAVRFVAVNIRASNIRMIATFTDTSDVDTSLKSMQGIFHEIAAQVRAQEEQRLVALEQSVILENSCVGISLIVNRVIVWTNSKLEEMFGYTKGELHGRSARIFYPSDEAYLSSGEPIHAAVSQGRQYESELIMARRDGSLFWARYYGKAIDPNNLSTGTIWVFEDISSRKAMEQALTYKTRQLEELNNNLGKRVRQTVDTLRQKESLLLKQTRLLVELAPDAIIVFDVEQGRIIDANAPAERLFGCSKQELFACSPLSFYKSEQPDGNCPEDTFYQHNARVLRGEVLVFERILISRQGVECICEVRLVRMPSEEQLLIRASFIDITERTRNQTELAKTLAALKRNLDEQKQFIGLISHELRTPLAIIDGAAQLLMLTASNDSDCLVQAVRIRSAGRRIVDLVDTCLTEERIATSGWELEFSKTAMHKLVQDVVEKVQSGTGSHAIESDMAAFPPYVTCDPTLIRVMLTNLLDNAIKYSPDGGTIRLKGWGEQTGMVYIQVSDHGIGFPPELSDKLFERFYRVWQIPGIPGAGLGLYLIKRIAELHGGGADASSLPGGGATFTVRIRNAS